jgi:hypothetical protein
MNRQKRENNKRSMGRNNRMIWKVRNSKKKKAPKIKAKGKKNNNKTNKPNNNSTNNSPNKDNHWTSA